MTDGVLRRPLRRLLLAVAAVGRAARRRPARRCAAGSQSRTARRRRARPAARGAGPAARRVRGGERPAVVLASTPTVARCPLCTVPDAGRRRPTPTGHRRRPRASAGQDPTLRSVARTTPRRRSPRTGRTPRPAVAPDPRHRPAPAPRRRSHARAGAPRPPVRGRPAAAPAPAVRPRRPAPTGRLGRPGRARRPRSPAAHQSGPSVDRHPRDRPGRGPAPPSAPPWPTLPARPEPGHSGRPNRYGADADPPGRRHP